MRREQILYQRKDTQPNIKGELCGDVLTLGLMVRAADQKCWGCVMNLETLQIEFVATINLQPRASIQVGETLLGLLVQCY